MCREPGLVWSTLSVFLVGSLLYVVYKGTRVKGTVFAENITGIARDLGARFFMRDGNYLYSESVIRA